MTSMFTQCHFRSNKGQDNVVQEGRTPEIETPFAPTATAAIRQDRTQTWTASKWEHARGGPAPKEHTTTPPDVASTHPKTTCMQQLPKDCDSGAQSTPGLGRGRMAPWGVIYPEGSDTYENLLGTFLHVSIWGLWAGLP